MAEAAPVPPHLGIERVYLRDVSFESPKAPEVFTEPWRPKVQVDINTRNRHVEGGRYEVVLTVTVEAQLGDRVVMVVELQQAGLFRLEGLEDEELRRQVLAAACPNILFPYARETLDSLVVKGSFPPFNLDPMNFDALYTQAMRQQQEKAGQPPRESGES